MRSIVHAVSLSAWVALVALGCGPGEKPSNQTGPLLTATAGSYSDGSGRLGLAVLATLRTATGEGPATAWDARLTDDTGTTLAAFTYDAPGSGSLVTGWFPELAPRLDGHYTLEVTDGTTTLSAPLTVSELGTPAVAAVELSADAGQLQWPAPPGAASYLCRVSQASGVQLEAQSDEPGCDLSALPPGEYGASVVAFPASLAAVRSSAEQVPSLPRWSASEARLGFVRPDAGSSALRLRAAGGPFHYGATQPGLAVLVDLRENGAAPSGAWEVEVTGPGLSASAPMRFSVAALQARQLVWSYDAGAYPGLYSVVARSNGRSVSSRFSVGEIDGLALPSAVTATAAPNGAADVAWAADPNARSTYVAVWAGGEFAGGQWVSTSRASFPVGSFTAGTSYDAYVATTSVDLDAADLPTQLSVSEDTFNPPSFTAR